MAKFKVLTGSGVEINDLFFSAESIDERSVRVTNGQIRAEAANPVGASAFIFRGNGLDVSGDDFDGTVTSISFLSGAEVARIDGLKMSAQALANAIADSAEETGFEPLLKLFSRYSYTYEGGVGDDGFTGGLKNDRIDGGGGGDRLTGELGDDIVRGGDGNDNLSGDYGLSTGSSGDFGKGGADTLYGEGGNDNIRGDAGNDQILGGAGDDTIQGWKGADKIAGGAGSDDMTGGEGADRFLFKTVGESPFRDTDEILDFDAKDRIDLHAIDANSNIKGNQKFTFIGEADVFTKAGQLAIVKSMTEGFYVAGNTDRDVGDIDFLVFVNLDGPAKLTGGDFIL